MLPTGRRRRRDGFSYKNFNPRKYIKEIIGCGAFTLCFILFFSIFRSDNTQPRGLVSRFSPKGPYVLPGKHVNEKCWIPKGRTYCAPQFIIAGAMKSGTTSMFTYLMSHPDVLPLRSYDLDPELAKPVLADKEVRFFVDPNWSLLVKSHGHAVAVEKYLDLFEEIPASLESALDEESRKHVGKITGEGSPMYICQPGIAERVKNVLPEIKVIMLLRNPIDRAYSEFWFKQELSPVPVPIMERFGLVGSTPEQVFESCFLQDQKVIDFCLDGKSLQYHLGNWTELFGCYRTLSYQLMKVKPSDPKCKIGGELNGLCIPTPVQRFCQPGNLFNSLYAFQVYEWIQQFPSNQLLIIPSEEFFSKPEDSMKTTERFLSLSPYPWDVITDKRYNIINSLAGQKDKVRKAMNFSVDPQESKSEKYPPLSKELRLKLAPWFNDFNDLLNTLVGTQFARGWNVYP